MTIKLTDEMIATAWGVRDAEAIVTDLIAIIERDYVVAKRCEEELIPGLRCTLPEQHLSAEGTDHAAKVPSGNRVNWS